MDTLPTPLAARLQALQSVLADPKFKAAVIQASNGLITPNRGTPWSLPLSQDPSKPTEPMQAASSNKPIVQNEAHNVSGTNRPGEQSPIPPDTTSGAVLEGKNRYKPENINPGPEGFQGRPGGEQEVGVLTQIAKEAPPNSRPAERGIEMSQPIDRNAPLTNDGIPKNRFGQAMPRKSVYLTSPK